MQSCEKSLTQNSELQCYIDEEEADKDKGPHASTDSWNCCAKFTM